MHRISYSSDSFVTTDEVAAKVMEYAAALGRSATDDIVRVPAVDEAGERSSVDVLLGPASQLISRDIRGEDVDLDTAGLLQDLDQRIATVARGAGAAVEPDPDTQPDFDPDWSEFG